MGNVRLWIETALREVVLLLHRDGVSSATIKRVSQRLSALQRDVVDVEHIRRTVGVDGVEATEICHGVVSALVSRVLEVEIPQRAVKEMEMEVRCLHQQIRAADKARDAALRQIEEAKRIEQRHANAHMYALHCYFREVFQLRQSIQQPSSHAAPCISQAPLSVSVPPVSTPISKSPLNASGGPEKSTFAGSPSPRRISAARQALAVDANGGAESSLSESMAAPSSAKGGPSPLLAVTRSMRLLRGASSNNANPVEAEVLSALSSVQQQYCTDAIFDYETYLDLQRSDELGWEGKYYALKEEYEAFQQQVDRDKAYAEKTYSDSLRRERDRFDKLKARLEREISRCKMIQLLASGAARDFRDQMRNIREQISRSSVGVMDTIRQLNTQVTSLSDYNQVLVDFVKAASKYMGEMTNSYLSSPSGGGAAANSTVEELTRFRFQRSLVPAATDTINQREAKLYWRRHDLSNIIFSTVMEQRQVHEERVAALATAQELRQLVMQLQHENTELLQQSGYSFVGLHTLIDAAAMHAQQQHNSRHAGASGAVGATATDLPLSIVVMPSGDAQSASDRPSSMFLELPQSTAWLVGRKWKPLVAPALPDIERLADYRAADGAAMVLHNSFLRPKLTEKDIDDSLLNDRLFLHRLFACARDPQFYMRDGDRNVILGAWRRHTHLTHERNKSIFQRILVRSLHAHLSTFSADMLADLIKRGIAEIGTAAMARPDVLRWRESIEELKEHNERMDFCHTEGRQQLRKDIDANIRALYHSVERAVVDQIRGIFPPTKTRAHMVIATPDHPVPTTVAPRDGSMGRTKSGRFLGSDKRRSTTMGKSGVFTQDSIDWRSSGQDCASTQTEISGDVGALDKRGRARAPLYLSTPSASHSQAPIDARPSRVALIQTVGQFATTSEQDDESSAFFRVESLQPPRCIAVPTSGGIGAEQINHMSIKLLTRSSLMTTVPSMRQAIEDSQQNLLAATSVPRGQHHTPMMMLRQPSAGSARRPDTAGSTVSVGSWNGGRASRLPSAGSSESGRTPLPAPPPGTPRVGSAAGRPPAGSAHLSSRTTSASRRIGSLPPPVYEPNPPCL